MVRSLERRDIPALVNIYNHYILATSVTLETEAVTEAAFVARAERIRAAYPYLVCEEEGEVLGFACLDAFNPRPGYRITADLSIYLAQDARGRGLGAALYRALEAECAPRGIRNIIAIISADNEPSLRFHRRMGFVEVAEFPDIAEKFGRSLGVVYMRKRLG